MTENVDRFRACEPNLEGVRIILSFVGEQYSPAHIQGSLRVALRFAGPRPYAPNGSTQMSTTDVIRRLGCEYTECLLGRSGDVEDAKENMVALIPQIEDSVRAGWPVLLWPALADTA